MSPTSIISRPQSMNIWCVHYLYANHLIISHINLRWSLNTGIANWPLFKIIHPLLQQNQWVPLPHHLIWFIYFHQNLRNSLLPHVSWMIYMRISPKSTQFSNSFPHGNSTSDYHFQPTISRYLVYVECTVATSLWYPLYIVTTRQQPHDDSHQSHSFRSPIFSTVSLWRRHPWGFK